MSQSREFDIAALRGEVAGSVVVPGDAEYDGRRKLFYGGLDNLPAALVRVADAGDVAAVVRRAAATGMGLAVRSGGHSLAGHSGSDGGLVIDLRALDDIEIDVDSATAWAGAGATAAAVTEATSRHGLAVGFGDTGSVGIGGITLGGGVGFLARKYGLTVDSLLAAEMVTADGRILQVDADHHPDLFWAIRGGGGNFGVATRFRFALHPVDPFVGGLLVLPGTEEAVTGFMQLSAEAPEELSTIANVLAGPLPFIPEELAGTTVLVGMVAWCGETGPGLAMMDRFRALGEPLMDMAGAVPYAQMFQEEEGEYAPTAAAYTGFTDTVDQGKVAKALDEIASSDAPVRVVQMRALGGAMARVPDEATAFAHRQRGFMVNVAAFYEGEEDRPSRERWVRDLAGVVMEGDRSGYVGFLGDEGPDRVRAAYPGATWDRLRRIKAEYDPGNLFRRNQNIPPAA